MSELNSLPRHLQAPPADLSEESKELFLHVLATGSYDAPARELLIEFCRGRDTIATIRGELAISGYSFIDKHNQPRTHPNVKLLLALINEYGKLFRLLGWDQAPDGQLPLFPGLRRNAEN